MKGSADDLYLSYNQPVTHSVSVLFVAVKGCVCFSGLFAAVKRRVCCSRLFVAVNGSICYSEGVCLLQ